MPVVVGLNWRRATAPAAVASMLTGFGACLASELLLQGWLASRGLDSVGIGVAAGLAVFGAVSRRTRPVPEENLRAFFGKDDSGKELRT
ncbi:MAG: hypothetical protein FJW35_01580 [Acidobacteria bacterium]|nr:hypothetical protein [Acidobacteriota bacterium]